MRLYILFAADAAVLQYIQFQDSSNLRVQVTNTVF